MADFCEPLPISNMIVILLILLILLIIIVMIIVMIIVIMIIVMIIVICRQWYAAVGSSLLTHFKIIIICLTINYVSPYSRSLLSA